MKLCTVEGCGKKHKARGYCNNHYRKFKNQGLLGGEKCNVFGCDNTSKAFGFCAKHYMQIKRHGKILKRTKYDPNKFIVEGNVCRIKLYDKECEEIAEAIVDTEDYGRIKNIKWCVDKEFYVLGNLKGKRIRLHRLIMNSKHIEVDHKNHNVLDNRKSNLRLSTESQNQGNRRKEQGRRTTSKFKGVDLRRKGWRSRICKERKRFLLGLFESEIDAAKAYDEKAIELFGEFALTNEMLGLL